jgi:hypothetical protein
VSAKAPNVSVPIFRISMQNASVFSVAYLLVAIVIEASRRWFPFAWTEPAAASVGRIPALTLQWFGLYAPLRAAVEDGRVSIIGVRLIFGVVSVAAIFAVALGVGALMWLGRWLIIRAERRRA